MDDENLQEYKLITSFHNLDLLNDMYLYSTKYSHLSDEELLDKFCSLFVPLTHKYPKINDTFKFKGKLRISWSFDMQYNKQIDLIFFVEDNPYFNYIVLYAKDFDKTLDDEFVPRKIVEMNAPCDINHNFCEEILNKSDINNFFKNKFLSSRFGSVYIPMQIEFTWYISSKDIINFSFLQYDEHLKAPNDNTLYTFYFCMGVIKSYEIFPSNTQLNFKKYISQWQMYDDEVCIIKKVGFPFQDVFYSISNTALAVTKTKINDYFINLKDKPNDKEGKIIAQLFSQKFSIDYIDENMKTQGQTMWEKDENKRGFSTEDSGYVWYYQQKMQENYYKSNKNKMINALNVDEYIVFILEILPNNWCKVILLKYPLSEAFDFYAHNEAYNQWDEFKNSNDYKLYMDKFYNFMSTITLASGYINSKDLDYFVSFPLS